MASYPIPGVNASPLDGPPPSGQVPQPSFSSFGAAGQPQAPPDDPNAQMDPAVPQEAMQGVLQFALAVDKAILALAQSVPAGSQEFTQARQLIKDGLAKFMASASGTAPPTMTGNDFPGGL